VIHYRFFGGKGGVGKTTCAAAYAVAEARAGRRTLLISTDPAPSAGDALRLTLTAGPRPVPGTRGRLHALEIDASTALERWLTDRRPLLETILLRGTWLDDADVASLLRLSLPGIDEVAALIELGRHARSGRYELLVADTAPTGHTLRMLAMPDLLRTLALVFDRLQRKHRAMVEALRGSWSPDESDELITALDAEGKALSALLRDHRSSAMHWVTLPEPMAHAETVDALAALADLGVHVETVVINRLTPLPDRPCRWCAARRGFERSLVDTLLKDLEKGVRIATVAARPVEPRGAEALAGIAREMAGRPRLPRRVRRAIAAATTPVLGGAPTVRLDRHPWSLLMFGGKGGVGKTTCAAAAALELAASHPRRAVLLLSADPAHSLGDALGVALADEPRQIPSAPPNLTAREVDAGARFTTLKKRYVHAIDELFGRIAGASAIDSSSDRQAMQDLLEFAPPGLDELIAIVEVSDALHAETAGGSSVVLDTAPTGHALRLLEMPALVHEWVKAVMRILLKYQPVIGVGDVGAVLLEISQGLGRLRMLLSDRSRAAFVVVTRPAELPVAETSRLLQRLRSLDIHVPAVIVNAVGVGTCGYCATGWRSQQRAIAHVRKSAGAGRSRALLLARAVVPPPQGPRSLMAWRATWATE
jgi:arsenite-transporting ATPase